MSDSATSDSQINGDAEPLRRLWRRWVSRFKGRSGEGSLRESLEEVIEEHEESERPLNPQERLMLVNLAQFGELRVDDAMVPRADIVAVDVETSFDQLIEQFRHAAHSRLPVYRKTLDNVVGMVHIKDLLKVMENSEERRISQFQRPVLFVPPSMRLLDLLIKMRSTHIHLAVVVDEYGGTDGLLTIEDLVEEIVGEIEDEHDAAEGPSIISRPDGSYDAQARIDIDEFEAFTDIKLVADGDDDDVETIGGFVTAFLGRVPERGEIIRHPSGLEFYVLDADARRPKRLRVRVIPDADTASDAND